MRANAECAVSRRLEWRVAVAASLLGLIISGCGGRDESVSTGVGAGASSPAVVEAERLFNEIADGMLGTSAQSEARFYLEHVDFQGMIIDCMAGKGFVYLAPPAFQVPSPAGQIGGGVLDPVDRAAVEADGLGLNATLDGLVAAAKAGEPIVDDTSGLGGSRPPEHSVPGWDEALSGCEPTGKGLNARVPHPSDESGAPISLLVEEVLRNESVSGAVAAYPECMRAAGWPVQAERDGGPHRALVWEVRGEFEDLLVEAARSFSSDPAQRADQVDQVVASAEWRRLVETRADAASADAACRQLAHDLALTALLQPLLRLKAEQGAEIDRLRAEWAAVEERADQTPDPARR